MAKPTDEKKTSKEQDNRNPVATAEKQMASQETTGVLDYGINLTDSYERFRVEDPLEEKEEK